MVHRAYGIHKKNMAIKIDEVCYSAEQRSE